MIKGKLSPQLRYILSGANGTLDSVNMDDLIRAAPQHWDPPLTGVHIIDYRRMPERFKAAARALNQFETGYEAPIPQGSIKGLEAHFESQGIHYLEGYVANHVLHTPRTGLAAVLWPTRTHEAKTAYDLASGLLERLHARSA